MPLVNWSEATPEDLAGFTADFLREELARRDLDTAGSKEEVINRLFADIAQNRLTTSQLPPPDSAAPSQRPNTTSPPTFDAAQSTELLRGLLQQLLHVVRPLTTQENESNKAQALNYPGEGQVLWSEIEDLLCLEVFQYTRRDPLSRHGLLNIDSMDRGQFRTYFRFERDDVRSLCRALQVPENLTTPQGVHVSGVEGLCLTLRRLAYPNRLRELEPLFGRHYSVISSATNSVLAHIDSTFGHLLRDGNNHTWLDIAKLQLFSENFSGGIVAPSLHFQSLFIQRHFSLFKFHASFFLVKPSVLQLYFFLPDKKLIFFSFKEELESKGLQTSDSYKMK
ncbi:hypothetical protein HPB50_018597 [Hyalomma asiaticum]|uniref:Uncharacterized protein n=1 Tax=Hyalomma asiaticum TaxID=266040 RepID=A0ACB7SF78_HYAAI|nr:hypothetical protein HPB50_018597 [Hyalomma asiaticum]